MNAIDFKFNEPKLLEELSEYVAETYTEHYGNGLYQATDVILDAGHGEGFCIGNIIKYAKRYGKKEGKNRKDILKILHYGLIALSVHDNEVNNCLLYTSPSPRD